MQIPYAQNAPELYKIIIGLVTVICGIVFIFGWFVKRWIVTTEDNIKTLFNSRNDTNNEVTRIDTTCKERYRKKGK